MPRGRLLGPGDSRTCSCPPKNQSSSTSTWIGPSDDVYSGYMFGTLPARTTLRGAGPVALAPAQPQADAQRERHLFVRTEGCIIRFVALMAVAASLALLFAWRKFEPSALFRLYVAEFMLRSGLCPLIRLRERQASFLSWPEIAQRERSSPSQQNLGQSRCPSLRQPPPDRLGLVWGTEWHRGEAGTNPPSRKSPRRQRSTRLRGLGTFSRRWV